MAEQAELEEALARLEAALSAVDVPEARPDLSGELEDARAAQVSAEERAEGLASELAAAKADLARAQEALSDAKAAPASLAGDEAERMRGALDALTTEVERLRSGTGDADAALLAEVDALRAARALDLAEMKALLSDLEPLLEPAHA